MRRSLAGALAEEFPNPMCLVAAPALVGLHDEVTEYAIHVNSAIARVQEDLSVYPLSGGALFSIRADHLALHRSVMTLCREGWAMAVTPILRTMLDLMVSTAVIVADRPEAEYRGFKYTHCFLKANLNNEALTQEQRTRMREQVDEGISLLPSNFRDRAKNYFYKERMPPYWYSPEFRRPGEAIEKLCPADVSQLYSLFSGGSHGGYLGLRILKDNPDEVHPNPRRDGRSQNVALSASIRLTLELFQGCDRFEGNEVNDTLSRMLFRKFRGLEPLLRPA